MKLLSSGEGGSFNELRQLKSALKGLSRCVSCTSVKTARTKSPFVCDDDEDDVENAWLLSTTQPAGLNNLPEVRAVCAAM